MSNLTFSLFRKALTINTTKKITKYNGLRLGNNFQIIQKRFDYTTEKAESLSNTSSSSVAEVSSRKYDDLLKNDYSMQHARSTKKLDVYEIDDTFHLRNIGYIHLNSYVFGEKVRLDILHKVFTWERACQRAGNVCVLNRSEMMYSKKKLRPQKGTGRARLGDRAAPQLHGGGKAHGPKPKNYAYFLPKRIVRSAFRMALSQRYKENNLYVMEDLSSDANDFIEHIKTRSNKKICIVDLDVPEELSLPNMGLENVEILSIFKLKLGNLLKNPILIISLNALILFQRLLSFDDLKVTKHNDYLKEHEYNKKLQDLFASVIKTPRKSVPRYILHKGARITVYSKRYDLKRRLIPYKKRGRGLGPRG